ncbi:DUF2283 domain-containing protein [Microbacterium aurum]
MKLSYDREANAAYLQIGDSIEPGESVRQLEVRGEDGGFGQFILDFDSDGKLLGLEILFASDVLPSSVLEVADA